MKQIKFQVRISITGPVEQTEGEVKSTSQFYEILLPILSICTEVIVGASIDISFPF